MNKEVIKQATNKICSIVYHHKGRIAFWILLLIGIAVRIYHFPTALQEMNCDEIMTAVNAKSIADTGKELGGIRFPVYLQAWGGQSVVLLYFMALCIKILGYSLFAIRLPLLIMSIVSMFVFYDLVKKISKKQSVALIALALVSISPWHILQSIWALDCNMFPHFLLIAMDLFYTGIINKNKKRILLYVSMLFFAISLYCYGVAIYFVPLFLLVMCLYLLKIKTLKLKNVLICAIIFSIFALPIITMFAINVFHIEKSIQIGMVTIPYYEGLSRTSDMIFFTSNPLEQLGKNIQSLFKVLIMQTDGAEWNSSKIFGATYHITILFSIIGLIKLIKNILQEKKNIAGVMIVSWLAISLLAGLLVNQVNINRLNSIWFVLLLLATFGIYALYQKIKYKQVYKIGMILLYTTIFTSFVIYFYSYYTKVVDNSGCFSRGFYQSLSYVKNRNKPSIWYDNIKNDGNLELYVGFNHDNSKQYYEIKDENALNEKIKNINENELLIVDVEFKQYPNIKNAHQIGDFLVVTK